MKIMFSIGEASGDLHGAVLAAAIRKIVPEAELFGMGGIKMKQAGVRIVYDIDNLGVIGIGEVIRKIPFFLHLRQYLLTVMKKERPDVLVCVDYPGFNMRLAKKAKGLGIPVIYYILPTIWAWNKKRGKTIADYTDLAISLFPFETELYQQIGAKAVYAGHPLLDTVRATMPKEEVYKQMGIVPETKTVLLMPGSRQQEVRRLFPVMLQAARMLQSYVPQVQFIVPRAPTIPRSELERFIAVSGVPVRIGEHSAYDMMQISTAAIVASGTATLETALMEVPTLLVYKVNTLTYALAKVLVHLDSIGLPNIIMGRRIMPELWQGQVTPQRIVATVLPVLTNAVIREQQRRAMSSVRAALGQSGAVRRIAAIIVRFVKEKQRV